MPDSKRPIPRPTRRWSRGRLAGQKRPFPPKPVGAIRAGNLRDLAPFTLAIDSKRRGCDRVRRRVAGRVLGACMRDRVSAIPRKTRRTVQVEVMENTRASLSAWWRGRRGSAAPSRSRTGFTTDRAPTWASSPKLTGPGRMTRARASPQRGLFLINASERRMMPGLPPSGGWRPDGDSVSQKRKALPWKI